uniref:Reverse transcriptase domain-containing protein n=1 Tax=Fagus sylvatica TaxID=28930 RepID=A0A2N9FNQ8_FAGSY
MHLSLTALKPLWRPGPGFKARDMGNNKAMFVFQNEADAERVLINGPWSFDKHLIILSRLDDTVPFSKACFDFMSFWVQIHDLPVKMMKPAACVRIGTAMSRSEGGFGWNGRVLGILSALSPLIQQPYGAWMKGEPERMGRHPARTAEKLGDRGYGVAGGMPGRLPVTREETQQTPPNGKISTSRISGNNIPRNQEKDTMEQSQESNLGTQRNACMESRKKGSEGVILEEGREEVIAVTPTVNEVLNGMVDKDPSLFVPKFKKKTPNFTWKRSVVQTKDTLHDVPIFTVAGSKRGNDDIMVDDGDWENVGKRACNVSVQGAGLGNPKAVRALHNMVKMKGPKVLFLLETKLDSGRMEGVRIKLGYDNVFSVPSLGRSGGLALLWKNEAEIIIQNYSQHHIDAHVDSQQTKCWRLTGFYGRPEQHRRKESWALLKHLSTLDSAPWLCIGDFNELLALHEKRGGNMRSLRQILEFQEAVNAGSVSDHLALVVLTKAKQVGHRRRKWIKRFEEKWATHPACEEIIRSSWNQQADVGSPMFQLCQKISRCRMALVDWNRKVFGALTLQDELHWRQRSRETWLEAGDRNTKYFHQKAKQRRGKNTIRGILDSNGRWCEDEDGMGEIAVQYFNDIFSSSAGLEVEETVRVIDRVVTTDMNCQLLSPFTALEIQQAAFQMHPSKSPGPDGYMLRKANHSHIVLIPKKQNPQLISDYRPISLSNVITNNVAVAFELIHALWSRRRGKLSQMAIKLDMSKAYDRVEWTFLERVMQRMGFASRWIHLMMACVRTTSYSAGREKRVNEVSICRGGPKISHLLFADDSLFFCDASTENCSRLLEVLSTYERASGQVVNRDKTAFFFSKNTPDHKRDIIQQMWGVRGSVNFERYLGLPVLVGKSKQQTFNGLKEMLAWRLQGWKKQSLSKAGRAVLIKTIAQVIPTYTMSCFKLPKVWCDSVNSLVFKYWWGQTRGENKIHWLNWGRLCSPKDEGGMGFRDLHCFNLALLAKQGWRMLTHQQSLFARVFKSKYFPGGSFVRAKLGSNPSFIWRSILAARDLLVDGIWWSLGSGKEVNIWNDEWGVSDLQKRPQAREVKWVAELIDTNRGAWDLSVLQEVFDPDTALRIQQMPLPNPTVNDSVLWKASTNGVFTVKSAYQLACSTRSTGVTGSSSTMTQYRKFWKALWKINVPNKIKIHLWRACMNAIPTGLALHRRRVLNDPLCPVCGGESETPTHALWTCQYVGSILQTMSCEVVELWVVTAWAIWYARNKFVHENFLPTPQATIDMAIRLLNDFKRVTDV